MYFHCERVIVNISKDQISLCKFSNNLILQGLPIRHRTSKEPPKRLGDLVSVLNRPKLSRRKHRAANSLLEIKMNQITR